jgi:hypothetical protein
MPDEGDIDILIRTGFTMDQNIAARQESGNFIGWWSVRVPREREAEAREILASVDAIR